MLKRCFWLEETCFAERAEMYRQRHLADEGIDFQKLERDLDNIFRETSVAGKEEGCGGKGKPIQREEQGEEKVQP